MDDEALIEEFIRIRESPGELRILVQTIRWEGPHSPISQWVTGMTCPRESAGAEIEKHVRKLLRDRRYFRLCEECRQQNPAGWMHSAKLCQTCASRNRGIVD